MIQKEERYGLMTRYGRREPFVLNDPTYDLV